MIIAKESYWRQIADKMGDEYVDAYEEYWEDEQRTWIPFQDTRFCIEHREAEAFAKLFGFLAGEVNRVGPTQPGDGSAPAFTVNLTPMTGWSIHT